ncbi:MAG: hypothetical protein QM482_08160 [Sulfurospirillum sp.]
MVISLSSPLRVGIYKDSKLIEEYCKTEQTSEVLPVLFDEILHKYKPKTLFFANGPGSFMAIKVSYIFLRSLSISLGIDLLGTDGFAFNQNRPIRAMRKVYFVKKDDKIETKVMSADIEQSFELPQALKREIFSKDCDPLYILPAV